jgi:ABC-type multidrug transport system fused ATPase/permease subunit
MAILVATHRINIARRSDLIYILENGEIAAAGTELLNTNNAFSNSINDSTV